MSDGVNRANVTVNLRDVKRNTIRDKVQIIFRNQRANSLSQRFDDVDFPGTPVVMPGVPAFPMGLAQVFISPTRYRFKSIFLNVVGGEQNLIDEDLFVDPDHATPTGLDFSDLAGKSYGARLLEILAASPISEADWNALDKRNRATILNLSAKMVREATKDGQQLIDQVTGILPGLLDDKHRERIYAPVDSGLLTKLLDFPMKFKPVDGGLHHFPEGFFPVSGTNSFKTRDKAGNIQLTFATDAGGTNFLADIDLDDHDGIEHAADVLKHKITSKETDPYDIHEILIFFQHLDPEYALL
jgi:hypothetical protein